MTSSTVDAQLGHEIRSVTPEEAARLNALKESILDTPPRVLR